MKLYAHECSDCNAPMSYSREPDVLPNALCKECMTACVSVANVFDAEFIDQHGRVITADTIHLADETQKSADWLYQTRSAIQLWCKTVGKTYESLVAKQR